MTVIARLHLGDSLSVRSPNHTINGVIILPVSTCLRLLVSRPQDANSCGKFGRMMFRHLGDQSIIVQSMNQLLLLATRD